MPRLTRPFVLADPQKLVRLMEEHDLKSARKLEARSKVSKSKINLLTSGRQPRCRQQTATRIAAVFGVGLEDAGFEPLTKAAP